MSAEDKSIYIKNMVCPRCISAVEGIFFDLEVKIKDVELGQVFLENQLSREKIDQLNEALNKIGFEILEPGKSSLISRIKSLIIDQIHHSDESLKINYSTFLSDKLHHDYSYISRLFSSVEGITIEKFITQQKIEKVKELLFYDEMSLTEIAYRMDYSSTAYLSTQFKKETGMTPTDFKNSHLPGHHNLDSI